MGDDVDELDVFDLGFENRVIPFAEKTVNRQPETEFCSETKFQDNQQGHATKQIAPVATPNNKQDWQPRIPGPAGRPPHVSGSLAVNRNDRRDIDAWSTPAWLNGMRKLGMHTFDEAHPAIAGSTIKNAEGLRQSGRLPRLLLYICALRHSYSGEAYVSLKDPTGTMGGTCTIDALQAHPHIKKGAVLLLQNVTILQTPVPYSWHHLCITKANIAFVIPREEAEKSINLQANETLSHHQGPGPHGYERSSLHEGRRGLFGTSPAGLTPLAHGDPFVAVQETLIPPAVQQVPSCELEQVVQGVQLPVHNVPPSSGPSNVGAAANAADELLAGLDDDFGL